MNKEERGVVFCMHLIAWPIPLDHLKAISRANKVVKTASVHEQRKMKPNDKCKSQYNESDFFYVCTSLK